MTVILHEDFSPGAPLKSRDLNDDGTITTVDKDGATAVIPATPATTAQAARILASQAAAATQATRAGNATTFRNDLTGQVGALRKIAYPGKYGATALTQAQQNALFARVLLSLARMVVAQADPTALDATDA